MSYTQLLIFRRRRSRLLRFLRALWRDTSALWREFRTSITTFLFVLFVVGYVYGELHELSGREELALIDRPYVMLQLMIVQPPYDAPAEWYLIIFWYALPLVFLFIVGNGVADFVRLFFDRNGRRDAWKEAVVSTYRNHVIVFGAGHVGLRVVRTLAEMGVDVVVVDKQSDKEKDFVLQELGVPQIMLDGRETITLEKAGLRYAETFVACTGDDHVNLEVVMKVRQINPKVRIVARVWDENLGAQMRQFLGVDAIISSSQLSAPVFAGLALGVEITQSIQVNGQQYSTLKLAISEKSFLRDRTIGEVQTTECCDIVLHVRGEKSAIQPAHHITLQPNDVIVIFAPHERSLHIAARNHFGD
jgi:Trk K+ transport system NAD-binding subunit